VVKHEANIQNAYIFLEAWEFNNKGFCMFHCQETGLTNTLLMVMFCMTNCSGFGLKKLQPFWMPNQFQTKLRKSRQIEVNFTRIQHLRSTMKELIMKVRICLALFRRQGTKPV
jgi:hypothetical protein